METFREQHGKRKGWQIYKALFTASVPEEGNSRGSRLVFSSDQAM